VANGAEVDGDEVREFGKNDGESLAGDTFAVDESKTLEAFAAGKDEE
jgi:hypothetical protein